MTVDQGRRLRGLGWLLAASVALLGCGPEPPDSREASRQTVSPPRRVVVLAPSAGEMLEELGQSGRVIGVGEFGPWPESLDRLPSVGGYDAPNLERMLELDCDLMITARSDAASRSHVRIEAMGIEVLALETSTFDGVFTSLDELGRRFAVPERADRTARRIRDELERVARQARGRGRPKVLFVVGRDPLYVAGPGSHIDELIRIAGGKNVAGDAAASYQQLSMEAALRRMPEIIIDASDNRPGAALGRHVGDWGAWGFLPAVRENRVYHVAPGRLVIPGLRLPEMARFLARLIHPERFGEPADSSFGGLDTGAPPPGAAR
jgi:iron complex transport system substrate-binding protein